jgi:Alginate lyase
VSYSSTQARTYITLILLAAVLISAISVSHTYHYYMQQASALADDLQLSKIAITAPKQEIQKNSNTNQIILPRTFLIDPTVLVNIKQSINAHNNTILLQSPLDQLLKAADGYLAVAPASVVQKSQLPSSGNKHDYLSLSKYWWPDPKKPNGLPYVRHDGKVNPEYYAIPDKENLEDMIDRVNVLSLAYYFSDNPQYAHKAAILLRTWFLDGLTHMNPNLNFAETIPGYNNTDPSGIIDTHNLPQVIDSIGLIQNSLSWTAKDQSNMIHWFEQYFNWILNSDAGKNQAQASNNQGTWYDEQVAPIALFLNKTDIAKSIIEKNTQERMAHQIKEDGSQLFEIKRTLSLSYSIFNLVGLFKLAHIAEHVGIDLWNYKTPKGVGLRNALDFLMPYMQNEKDWPYKQISLLHKQDFEDAGDLLYQAAIQYNDSSYLQPYNQITQGKNISRSIDNVLLYGTVYQ